MIRCIIKGGTRNNKIGQEKRIMREGDMVRDEGIFIKIELPDRIVNFYQEGKGDERDKYE